MRKKSPERGASFAGLHFAKENGKYLLTFSPTKGTACYFIQVDAYDKERAQRAAGDVPMLQDALRAELGKNLRYLGPGDCPRVQ